MRNIIVCWTAFNSFSLYKDHRELSEQWIKKRYLLWAKYTYPSIAQQTFSRFVYLIICNKKSKAIVDNVFKPITSKDNRVMVVYRDEETKTLIENINRKYRVVYSVRIDSDDMYSKDTFSYILKYFPFNHRYAYFRKGYSYDIKQKKLWVYDCIGSGPFFVERCVNNYDIRMVRHHLIKKRGGLEFGKMNFMVTINNSNSSSRINKKNFKSEITGELKTRILKRFLK